MRIALILSLGATLGLIGVEMVNALAALAGRPSWNIPKHPR